MRTEATHLVWPRGLLACGVLNPMRTTTDLEFVTCKRCLRAKKAADKITSSGFGCQCGREIHSAMSCGVRLVGR